MLFRFVKHTHVEWGESHHTWYAEGDVVVGKVVWKDRRGVWLQIYSDDDQTVIVEADSFVVLDRYERWPGTPPGSCPICDQELQNCFFCGEEQVMCHRCWLADECLSDHAHRYEYDKAGGDWVRTR